VGVVCLDLGPLSARRGATRALAEELVQRADQLMYRAKHARSASIDMAVVRVDGGRLVDSPAGGGKRLPSLAPF
jgi:hypothetical protein